MSIRNKILIIVYAVIAVAGIVLTVVWSPDAGVAAVLLTNIMLFGIIVFQRYQLGKVQQRSLNSLQLENVMLPRISARSAKILEQLETLDTTLTDFESRLDNSVARILTDLEEKYRKAEDHLTKNIAVLKQKKDQADNNLAVELATSDKRIIGLLHAQQLHMERLNEKLESLQRAAGQNHN